MGMIHDPGGVEQDVGFYRFATSSLVCRSRQLMCFALQNFRFPAALRFKPVSLNQPENKKVPLKRDFHELF